MMKSLSIILSLFLLSFSVQGSEYKFAGSHFICSYYDCDKEALCDLDNLRKAMQRAVNQSGATVLNFSEHVFPPDGLTMVWLLSESHASIHTYPEFGSCFVDLFTCGSTCSHDEFDKVLEEYLQPKRSTKLTLSRE